MSIASVPPAGSDQLEQIFRRLYELERRLIPEFGDGPPECCVLVGCDVDPVDQNGGQIAPASFGPTNSVALNCPTRGTLVIHANATVQWLSNVTAAGGASIPLTVNNNSINVPFAPGTLYYPTACPANLWAPIAYTVAVAVDPPGLQTVNAAVRNHFLTGTTITAGMTLTVLFIPGPAAGCGFFQNPPE